MLVIDTSCLWHLFGIPKRDGTDTEELRNRRKMRMKERFTDATKRNARLYVPYAVIFELANSIAHVDDDHLRKELTVKFISSIEIWFNDDSPWFVTPADPSLLRREDLLDMCRKFAHSSQDGVGLSDMAVYLEAERLKYKHTADGRHVHIWTLDGPLRGYAPDSQSGCPLRL